MTPTEAADILRHHNAWRRRDDESLAMIPPKLIGEAIDVAVAVLSAQPVAEFEGYVEGMPVIRLVGGKLTAGTELYARPK